MSLRSATGRSTTSFYSSGSALRSPSGDPHYSGGSLRTSSTRTNTAPAAQQLRPQQRFHDVSQANPRRPAESEFEGGMHFSPGILPSAPSAAAGDVDVRAEVKRCAEAIENSRADFSQQLKDMRDAQALLPAAVADRVQALLDRERDAAIDAVLSRFTHVIAAELDKMLKPIREALTNVQRLEPPKLSETSRLQETPKLQETSKLAERQEPPQPPREADVPSPQRFSSNAKALLGMPPLPLDRVQPEAQHRLALADAKEQPLRPRRAVSAAPTVRGSPVTEPQPLLPQHFANGLRPLSDVGGRVTPRKLSVTKLRTVLALPSAERGVSFTATTLMVQSRLGGCTLTWQPATASVAADLLQSIAGRQEVVVVGTLDEVHQLAHEARGNLADTFVLVTDHSQADAEQALSPVCTNTAMPISVAGKDSSSGELVVPLRWLAGFGARTPVVVFRAGSERSRGRILEMLAVMTPWAPLEAQSAALAVEKFGNSADHVIIVIVQRPSAGRWSGAADDPAWPPKLEHPTANAYLVELACDGGRFDRFPFAQLNYAGADHFVTTTTKFQDAWFN